MRRILCLIGVFLLFSAPAWGLSVDVITFEQCKNMYGGTGTCYDRAMAFYGSLGYAGTLYDREMAFLSDQGQSGTWSDRWNGFLSGFSGYTVVERIRQYADIMRGLVFYAPFVNSSLPLGVAISSSSLTFVNGGDNTLVLDSDGAVIGAADDVLTMPSSGNVIGTAGTVYLEGDSDTAPTNGYFVDLGTNRPALYNNAIASHNMYDGTSVLTGPGEFVAGTTYKLVSSWGGSTMEICRDGGAVSSESFDGDMNVNATVYLGSSTAGSSFINGHIKNLRIWNRKLTTSEKQAITN